MQFIIRENGVDLEVVNISEIDKKIVEHYVKCFKTWICEGPVSFVKGKSAARRNALKSEAIAMLSICGESIPSDEEEMFSKYFALSNYKPLWQSQQEEREERLLVEQKNQQE